jgi:ABC-type sugar transport system permease subunit
LDGAGPWAQIRHITLPLLSRVLFFVVVISLINTLQVFDPIYVLTQGGPSESTTVLSYYIYKTAFEFGLAGKASAMAFVLLAVLVLMVLLLLRSFTRPAEEV